MKIYLDFVKLFMIVVVFLCLFACKKEMDLVRYQDGQQLLMVNDIAADGSKLKFPEIMKVFKDSISVGEELLVKIFLGDSDLKIIDAFVACEPVANPVVDTITYKVSGCSQGLIVQNDTIIIGFRPKELGVQGFPEITILTKGRDKIFRTFKYSFGYTVVAN